MSYCTILITKKSETEIIKKETSQNNIKFRRNFWFTISTKYYSQKNFKNIPQIYNNFSQYDVALIENYYSSLTNQTEDTWGDERLNKKIEKFKERGWSEDKIQEYRETAKRKMEPHSLFFQKRRSELEKVLFELANKYFIAFVYYWQGKDENKIDWQGFKGKKDITEPQENYEENVIYLIDEKMHKKVLDALSYSLGGL